MKPKEIAEKKTWKQPELQIISQNNVTGGAQAGYYEKSIQSSFPSNIGSFQYVFKFNGGGSGLAHHKKTFYLS